MAPGRLAATLKARQKSKQQENGKVTSPKGGEDSSDDSEGSLPPDQALSLFKDLIRSNHGHQHVAKKRKLNSAAAQAQKASGLAAISNGHGSETASGMDKQSEAAGARHGSQRRSRARKQASEDGVAEIWDSMQQYFSRSLDDTSIAELAKEVWREDSSEPFKAAWHDTDWMVTGTPLSQVAESLSGHGIRPKLISMWKDRRTESQEEFRSDRQRCMLGLLRSYKDVLFTAHPYPERANEEDEMVDAALLHCLDHIQATAQRIKKNNEALKAQPDMDVPQDQGYTRPKVLILLPTRNAAHEVVERLLDLAIIETRTDSIQNKGRFQSEFGEDPEETEEAGWKGQPADHAALFHGNTDDHFALGVKLTRGAVKLYADFHQSDIIVASPIGLVTKRIDGEEEELQDLDYLSSIEIVLAPRCDVFQMQNWAHVNSVFEAINQVPKEYLGADVMRIQEWHLAGHARYYRQNILFSSFGTPELNALFTALCHSHAGKAKTKVKHQGVLDELQTHQIRQMFQRFPVHSPATESEQRFSYFKTHVWPRIRDSGTPGQMIFVPTYFDYVRLRGLLRQEELQFEGLTEYADGSEVARGRHRFATGKTRIALYTERSHFYHRKRTRGVKDIFFYQLPLHAQYYTEVVSMMVEDIDSDASHATVSVLFSKLDALRLERVVGTARARKMLSNKSSSFLFC